MYRLTSEISRELIGNPGNPWERLRAPHSLANWLITLKTEMPVVGNFDVMEIWELGMVQIFGEAESI
jgi:hypothetical protein